MHVKLGSRGTITIPKELRERLQPESTFEVVRREDGVIELRPQEVRDPSQAWFWTEKWQQMEREADEDLVEGRYHDYDGLESFIRGS
jgi:AbrB family looped-hinge helix DNA binding protein